MRYLLALSALISGCATTTQVTFITCVGSIEHCELSAQYVKCNKQYYVSGYAIREDGLYDVDIACINEY